MLINDEPELTNKQKQPEKPKEKLDISKYLKPEENEKSSRSLIKYINKQIGKNEDGMPIKQENNSMESDNLVLFVKNNGQNLDSSLD